MGSGPSSSTSSSPRKRPSPSRPSGFTASPVRTDIPLESLPAWMQGDIRAMPVDWDLLAERGSEWMQAWDEDVKGARRGVPRGVPGRRRHIRVDEGVAALPGDRGVCGSVDLHRRGVLDVGDERRPRLPASLPGGRGAACPRWAGTVSKARTTFAWRSVSPAFSPLGTACDVRRWTRARFRTVPSGASSTA